MTDVNVIAEVNKEEVQVFAEAKRSFMKTALGAGTAAYHAGKQAGSDQRIASSSGSSTRPQAAHRRPCLLYTSLEN